MSGFLLAVCGLFGLVVGSFLNVVIYRVPQHLSIVAPPSACPTCHVPIRPRDNVPVLSWLVLRGRCRNCHQPISVRYPAVELATGALFVLAGVRLGDSWDVPAFCALLAGLLALAIVDVESLTLPRNVVWCHLAIVAVLLTGASAITGHWRDLLVGAVCALAWSGLYFAMYAYSPRLIGFGDVRFALVLGLSLGYLDLAYPGLAFLLANLLGLFTSLVLIATKRLTKDQPVPYGVFLAAGTAATFFFGPSLARLFHLSYWHAHL